MEYYSELISIGLVCWTISFYFLLVLASANQNNFPDIYISVNSFKYYIYVMSIIVKLINKENFGTLVDVCDITFAFSGFVVFGLILLEAATCRHSFIDKVPYSVYLILVLSWVFSLVILTLYYYDLTFSFTLIGVSINTKTYLEFIVGMLEIFSAISLSLSKRFFINLSGAIIIALQTVGSLLWVTGFSLALTELGVEIIISELAKNFIAFFSLMGLIPLAHIWMASNSENENSISLIKRRRRHISILSN